MRELLKEILQLTRDNNRMLKEIIGVINAYGRNADNENMQDFGRNVLANLLSNMVDGNTRRF